MNRRFKKIIAVVCAIAMVVTSVTVYNTKSAKADDYSGLTYTQVGETTYYVAAANDDFPFQMVQDQGNQMLIIPQVAAGTKPIWPDFTDVTLNGAEFNQVAGAGIYIPYSALTDNAYNVYEGTSAVSNNRFQIIIKAGTPVEGETTTPDPDAPTTIPIPTTTPAPTTTEAPITTVPGEEFDPSTITSWTKVLNSTTLSYCVMDGKINKVSVKPEMHGDTFYAAFALAAKFKSVTLNDEAITPRDGADIEIPKASFKEGYNKLVIEDFYGNETVTMWVKAEKEAETTTPEPTTPAPYVDGAVLVDDSGVKEVPAFTGGDYWQAEFNNAPVNYVQGKKYVAEVVVSSNVDKKIKLIFQRVNIWDFVDADAGYEVDIAAGSKVKITYVFEATKSTDNGNFDIYLGSVAEAATLDFETKKLTTYNEVPEGVVTGVENVSEVETTPEVTTPEVTTPEETTPEETTPAIKATVDGEVVEVIDGKVTLGDADYGYFSDGKMYAPNTSVEVTEDMTFTSVNELSVAMANGAGIRYAGTAGIRFQASVASDNMDAVASDAIKEGTLITASDIYQNFSEELTLTYSHAKIDVKNSGWFNGQTGTYCGSVCNVIESNYIRNFTARAYVTVNYENADAVTIYSNMGPTRSISQIATAVKNAGYPGIPDASKSIIDSFIK